MARKLLLFCMAMMPLLVSCYDDVYLRNKLREHEQRISALEKDCQEMNTNISSLQTIMQVLQEDGYLTSAVAIEEGGVVVGYRLNFSTGETVDIYLGEGNTEYVPSIGVRMDEDGVYYWTLDGEWLLDEQGNKIPTTGKDGVSGGEGGSGEQGVPGEPGKDGVTPLLKIEDGYWYVSYDDGENWDQLGQATGDKGEQGNPGVGGDSMFSDLDYSSSADYVVFYLGDGTQIKIPTWSAFESLKELCEKANENIKSLQTIVEALQDSDYVMSVTPIYEGTTEIGYKIKFSKSGEVTIYHGKDGKDGEKGEDGAAGSVPLIGIAMDADGLYYWTLDGEWLLDNQGNKIPTTGKDGVSGGEGDTGKNGVTPQLKIEDGYWYVSYDNGLTWKQLGLAQGPQGEPGVGGDSMIKDMDYTTSPDYVVIMLDEETEIRLPKYRTCPVSVALSSFTGNTVTFEGKVERKSLDLKVTVYYATYSDVTVYKHVGSASLTEFPGNEFTLRVNGLAAETQYFYFTEVVYNGTKTFSDVQSFVTGEEDAYQDWGDGEDVEDNI